MSDGDTATVDVDFVFIKTKVSSYSISLAGKCFVDLEHVDIFQVKTKFLGQFFTGEFRRVAHQFSVKTSNCEINDFQFWCNTKFFGFVCRHNNNCSSTIVEAGRVAGGNSSAFYEARTEFCQLFKGLAFSWTFICIKNSYITFAVF